MTIEDIRVGDRYVWVNNEDTPFIIVSFNGSTIMWHGDGQIMDGYNCRYLIDAVNNGSAYLLVGEHNVKYRMDKFRFV